MENKRYNGWANYETWRINLEWFDDISTMQEIFEIGHSTKWQALADDLRQYVEDGLACDNESTESYALSFVSNVNFYEIADHLITDVQDMICNNCNEITDDEFCCKACEQEYKELV